MHVVVLVNRPHDDAGFTLRGDDFQTATRFLHRSANEITVFTIRSCRVSVDDFDNAFKDAGEFRNVRLDESSDPLWPAAMALAQIIELNRRVAA